MDDATTQVEATLRAVAREQKTLEFAHRRTAKRLYEAADALHRATLAQLGIGLTTIGTDQRSQSHDRQPQE